MRKGKEKVCRFLRNLWLQINMSFVCWHDIRSGGYPRPYSYPQAYVKPRAGGYSCPIMGQGCQNLAWGTTYETPWECEGETNCSGFYPFPDGGSWTPPLYPLPGHGHGHKDNLCLRSAPCKHPVYLGRGVHTCQGPFANAVCDAAGGGWVWIPNGPSTIYNP